MDNKSDNSDREIEKLKAENEQLKGRLKLYTNGERSKRFYKNNAESIKQKATEYINKLKETNPEKLKEWRHTAYLNQKAKLKKKNEEMKKEDS